MKLSGIKLYIIIARFTQKIAIVIIITLISSFSVTKAAALVADVSFELRSFHPGRVNVSLWWTKCY
jgi:hypothetical protein